MDLADAPRWAPDWKGDFPEIRYAVTTAVISGLGPRSSKRGLSRWLMTSQYSRLGMQEIFMASSPPIPGEGPIDDPVPTPVDPLPSTPVDPTIPNDFPLPGTQPNPQ